MTATGYKETQTRWNTICFLCIGLDKVYPFLLEKLPLPHFNFNRSSGRDQNKTLFSLTALQQRELLQLRRG